MKNSEKNNKKIIIEENKNQGENAASVEIKRKRGRPKKTDNNNLIELKNKKNKINNIDNPASIENTGFEGDKKINKNNKKNTGKNKINTEKNDIIPVNNPDLNQVKTRGRGRPKGTTGTIRLDRRVNTEPGDNTKFLTHDIKIMHLPTVDINNPDDVQQRIDDYFSICAEDDIKPSIASLALAFSVSRFDLYDYVNGRNEKIKNIESIHILKNAYNVINSYYEHCMNNGKINPVAGIFLMKNNMGYKDNTEHVISVNQDNNVTDNDIYNRAALVE